MKRGWQRLTAVWIGRLSDLLAGIQPAPWGVPLAQADEPATPTLH